MPFGATATEAEVTPEEALMTEEPLLSVPTGRTPVAIASAVTRTKAGLTAAKVRLTLAGDGQGVGAGVGNAVAACAGGGSTDGVCSWLAVGSSRSVCVVAWRRVVREGVRSTV